MNKELTPVSEKWKQFCFKMKNFCRGHIATTLFGINPSGKLLPGFPLNFSRADGGAVNLSNLAAGDINNDGQKELIFNEISTSSDSTATSQEYKLHAVLLSGQELVGWPIVRQIYSSGFQTLATNQGDHIALGDMTGDGIAEVAASYPVGPLIEVFTGQGNRLYSIPGSTKLASGSSQSIWTTNVAIADLDGDGKGELIAPVWLFETSAGLPAVFIYKDGVLVQRLIASPVTDPTGLISKPIFPINLSNSSAPIIDDMDGDGMAELAILYPGIIGGTSGFLTHSILYVWNLPYQSSRISLDWPMTQANLARTGEFRAKGIGSTPKPLVPNAPSNLVAKAVSTTQIDLSWMDNALYEDGVKIERSLDAINFSEVASLSVNSTSYSNTGLSPSTQYTYRVRAYNATGNSSYSNTVSATTQDTIRPSVAIISPYNGALVSGSSVTIAVSVSDNAGVGITRVDFYVDSTLVGLDNTSPYSVSFDSTKYANGSHSISAKAYDAAGNVGTSSVTSINVSNATSDTTPPSVSVTGPANGSVVPRRTSVAIAASASDNVGVTRVEIYVNNSLICTDSASPYSCTWSVPGGKAGKTYQIQAKAFDAAGNVGSSAIVTVRSW